MNRIFAIIFSLQLILSPVALAQGSGDQFREGDSSKGGGGGFYASQILSLSTGLIGANILTSCKLGSTQPSIYIFMGGSLVYIGSEIFGGKALNNYHNAKASNLVMVKDKMVQGGDLQKEVLVTALKEEKNTRDFIKKRKTWMIAVSTIYTAAMAMAIIEAIWGKLPPPAWKSDSAGCAGGYFGPGWAGQLLQMAVVMAYTFGTGKGGGSGAISQYGGMAIGLATMVPSVGKAVSAAYSSALGRSISFGASAVLSTTVTVGLAKRQSIAEENIGKMEKVLAEFKKNTEADDGLGGDSDNGENSDTGPEIKTNIKSLAESNTPKHCFSQTNNQLDYSEKGCGSPIKLTKPNFNLNLVTPTLQTVSNMASDMAQAVASGDMGRANIAAGEIAAMAARVKDIKDGLQKNLNDRLKAEGKPAIDFDKNIAEQVKSMEADLNKGLGSQAPALAAADKADLSQKPSSASSSTVTTASAPAAAPVPASNFTFTESSVVDEVPVAVETASLGDSLDQYETTVEDISKKSEVSIFKQVSNRYFLNYTKIFKEKKKLEEAEPK